MLYLVIFEIVYSITDVVVSPSIYIHESVYMVFINEKDRIVHKTVLRFFLILYCGCFGFSLCVFSIQFYYRYLVILGSKLLKTLNDWRFIFWVLCPLGYGVIWAVVSSCILYQTPEANEFVRNVILRDFDMNIDDIIFYGAYFFPKTSDGLYHLDVRSFVGVTIFWILVISSLTIILFCGIKCYTRMRSVMTQSTKFRNLQNQLFYALLVQTIIPIVLMHIPVSCLFIFPLFELDVGNMADILAVTIALFPAIDPLPTMFIIKNYRITILEFICSCLVQTIEHSNTHLQDVYALN
ncbi:unnamed protein product [Caenorhabditis angaria]|uniref:Seven TM Receptor n=1 Tax=Caenorhabditis angaria TaxID=860376 RepID=A0A9P1IV83_9PELO|nr:unnamed protein product [Caenorhabditis angaria]